MSKKAIVDFIPAQGVAYIGPGDVVSGSIAWWGLRAYSSAAIGQNAVRLIRASDNVQQNFVTVSGGGLDMSSINTFLTSTTGKVVTLFDQTGNGFDVTQAAGAFQQVFGLSILGSFAAVQFDYTKGGYYRSASSFGSSTSQPWSASFVAAHKVGGGGSSIAGTAGGGIVITTLQSTLTGIYAGTFASVGGLTDGSTYSISFIGDSTSSIICVNGADTTGLNAGTRSIDTSQPTLGTNSSGDFFDGNFYEAGLWPGGFSAGQRSDMSSNQRGYWGF